MGGAIALPLQNDFVGAVAETVDGGRPQDTIGKGVRPFRDVQVGGDDGALSFVSFGDHLVEVLILNACQRFEAEVVDDQQIDTGEFGKLPFKTVGGSGGVDLGEHPGGGGKQNIITFTDGAVPEGLGDVAFTLMESFA